MIPYGRQEITQADIDAVVNVLQSDFLTQGPKVPAFEQAIAQYCGAKHAIAVNSATSALHIACMALDLSQNDWLWTTPVTFVASANCGLYCGAQIDFVDIDSETYNLCPKKLAEKLALAKTQNRLPKVLVAVHLCGQPCDMAAIHRLAQEYNFKIIEDASHAIGGKYKGQPIGQGQFSDITVFSFHPVKIITSAEGGMCVTNDDDLAAKMALFRSHGITRDIQQMTHEPDGDWYYQQIDLGYNYRMTELQAALGLSQMDRLDEYISKRHDIAKYYDEKLQSLPVMTPWQHEDSYSGLHLYVIKLKLDQLTRSRKEVFDALRAANIMVNVHYIPVHTQPYYAKMGFKPDAFPNSLAYYEAAISLPMYPTLTVENLDYIIKTLHDILMP